MVMVSQFPGIFVKNSGVFGPKSCANGKGTRPSSVPSSGSYLCKTFRERPPVVELLYVGRISIAGALSGDLVSREGGCGGGLGVSRCRCGGGLRQFL